jgi:hypothetical protein
MQICSVSWLPRPCGETERPGIIPVSRQNPPRNLFGNTYTTITHVLFHLHSSYVENTYTYGDL